MSFVDDLKNVDPNNPGEWPLLVQLAAMAVLFVGILYAGYYFDVSKQLTQIDKLEAKETELKETYEGKQRQAANLEALKEQLREIEQSFGDMLRQLPNSTEVPGLIVDVSQTGLAAGLEFNLFRPTGEQPAEFYAQLPIQISVTGDYHQLGEFISGIAALPRIVTTHNINITKAEGNLLNMTATAMTYRALDEEG